MYVCRWVLLCVFFPTGCVAAAAAVCWGESGLTEEEEEEERGETGSVTLASGRRAHGRSLRWGTGGERGLWCIFQLLLLPAFSCAGEFKKVVQVQCTHFFLQMLVIVVCSRSPCVFPLLTHVSGFSAAPYIVAISCRFSKRGRPSSHGISDPVGKFFLRRGGCAHLPGVATHVYVCSHVATPWTLFYPEKNCYLVRRLVIFQSVPPI